MVGRHAGCHAQCGTGFEIHRRLDARGLPVHTGYEPITRTSQEFGNWVYDFLGSVGFTQTGNFLTDLRAYNNAQPGA